MYGVQRGRPGSEWFRVLLFALSLRKSHPDVQRDWSVTPDPGLIITWMTTRCRSIVLRYSWNRVDKDSPCVAVGETDTNVINRKYSYDRKNMHTLYAHMCFTRCVDQSTCQSTCQVGWHKTLDERKTLCASYFQKTMKKILLKY